jgi:hypothetical protein
MQRPIKTVVGMLLKNGGVKGGGGTKVSKMKREREKATFFFYIEERFAMAVLWRRATP